MLLFHDDRVPKAQVLVCKCYFKASFKCKLTGTGQAALNNNNNKKKTMNNLNGVNTEAFLLQHRAVHRIRDDLSVWQSIFGIESLT